MDLVIIAVVEDQPFAGLPEQVGILYLDHALIRLIGDDQAKVAGDQPAGDPTVAGNDRAGLEDREKGGIEIGNFADQGRGLRGAGAIFRHFIAVADQEEGAPVAVAGNPRVIGRNLPQRRHRIAMAQDRGGLVGDRLPVVGQATGPFEKVRLQHGLGRDGRLRCRQAIHRAAQTLAHADDQRPVVIGGQCCRICVGHGTQPRS